MKVLDASVLIASFDPDDAHHANAEARLTQDLEATWGINTLILAEVLAGPAGVGRDREVLDAIGDLGIVEVPFPADAALQLARLRAATELTMPDCCVLLATGEVSGQVLTIDDRLGRVAQAQGLGDLL